MIKYLRFLLILLTVLYCYSGYSQFENTDSIVPYRVGKKWGFSNMQGRILIEPQYELASFFYKGRSIINDNGLFYLIDSKNKKYTKGYIKINLRTDCEYKCYIVKDTEKWDELDTNGNVYNLEYGCQCSDSPWGWRFEDPLIKKTYYNNLSLEYFINDSQKTLYKSISPLRINLGEIYTNYFYVITNGNKWGVVNNNSKNILQKLDTIYQSIIAVSTLKNERRYIVKKNNQVALISEEKIIIPFYYKSIEQVKLRDDMVWVETENNSKGFVNLNGFEYFKD